MKRIWAFGILLYITTITVNAQYSASELQQIYKDMVEDEGISAWVDSDGDVAFEYEDHNYFIQIMESDPEFFRIGLIGIWSIDSESERLKVLEASHYVTAEKKVVKVYTVNDKVWVSVEMFVGSPTVAGPVFKRSLEEMEDAVDEFVLQMR